MLPLRLALPPQADLYIVAVGAHPDDIEIGAGGLAMALAESHPGLRVRYVLLTGSSERQAEARHAASCFFPGAEVIFTSHGLPEGRLPAIWDEVKGILTEVASSSVPDLIIAPQERDAHQDHRTIGEIIPTVFRDHLYLAYEIPKWDGDLGRGQPSVYVPMSADRARRKVELLHSCFPSQHNRDWWDDEVFLGLARLRGIECRAPYAEAFSCAKSVLVPSDQNALV